MIKLKWGVISTGKIAHRFATDIQYCSNAEIIAVGSRDQQKASEFCREFSIPNAYDNYEKLCSAPEVEAVYIGTPHSFHFENSLLAIQNGKSVLCEKPITVNKEQLETLISEAKKQNVFLMEGMWTYFLPSIMKAKEWIEEGKIGEIEHIKASFGFNMPFDPNARLYNPELAGGALFDMGIYPMAIAWYFLNKMPEKMELQGKIAETGVDEDVFGIFTYDKSYLHFHTSFRARLENSAWILGDERTIEIPDFWEASEVKLYEGREILEHFKDTRKGRGFEYQIQKVSQDIMEGKPESEIVPFETSLHFQQQFEKIFSILKNK